MLSFREKSWLQGVKYLVPQKIYHSFYCLEMDVKCPPCFQELGAAIPFLRLDEEFGSATASCGPTRERLLSLLRCQHVDRSKDWQLQCVFATRAEIPWCSNGSTFRSSIWYLRGTSSAGRQGLARFRADRLSSPTAPLWLLIDCGGLDVPVVVGEKNSSATGRVLTPKRLEAVPLCGGCARVGGNKKLLSHL